MAKTLLLVGGVFLALGALALAESADASLRYFPALVLPLGRPLVAGPDIPAHLTNAGIAVVYVLPAGILLTAGIVLLYRRRQ